MFKIGDKVRLERRQEENEVWEEVGKGIITGILTDKTGEICGINYRDREWVRKGSNFIDTVMICGKRFRAKKQK